MYYFWIHIYVSEGINMNSEYISQVQIVATSEKEGQ